MRRREVCGSLRVGLVYAGLCAACVALAALGDMRDGGLHARVSRGVGVSKVCCETVQNLRHLRCTTLPLSSRSRLRGHT